MNIQNLGKTMILEAVKLSNTNSNPKIDVMKIVREMHITDEIAHTVISYLATNHYVDDTFQPLGCAYPVLFTLTGKGIDWANDYNPHAENVQNISFNNNYGSVGNNNTVNINNYFSFDNFDKEIAEHISKGSSDYRDVQDLRNKLMQVNELRIPVSQGYFSKFSSLMQKHSWITSQIAAFLIHFTTKC